MLAVQPTIVYPQCHIYIEVPWSAFPLSPGGFAAGHALEIMIARNFFFFKQLSPGITEDEVSPHTELMRSNICQLY